MEDKIIELWKVSESLARVKYLNMIDLDLGRILKMSNKKGRGCEFDSKIVAQGMSFESPEFQINFLLSELRKLFLKISIQLSSFYSQKLLSSAI